MSDWPPAVLSIDGQYRYMLARRWASHGKTVAFIGLNPSTADATQDDPTIRRCVGYGKLWGASTLLMVNLFGFRSTDPAALLTARDPVGPHNDEWLRRVVEGADLVIAAWGAQGNHLNRAQSIRASFGGRLHALGLTKSGMPRHPLYMPAAAQPAPY